MHTKEKKIRTPISSITIEEDNHVEVYRVGDCVRLEADRAWTLHKKSRRKTSKYADRDWIGQITSMFMNAKGKEKIILRWFSHPFHTEFENWMDFHHRELFIDAFDSEDSNSIDVIIGKCNVKCKYDIQDIESYIAESPHNYFYEFSYNYIHHSFTTAFPNHPHLLERRKLLEERTKDKKALSLFSGSGGMDLGFLWAGIETSWAVEFNENAVKTFERNFPSVRVLKDDAISVLQLAMWAHGRNDWKEIDYEEEFDCLGFMPELDEDWLVDAILDWRYAETKTRNMANSAEKEFFVHWRGYPETDNSWVAEEDMSCPDLINLFAHRHFQRTSQAHLDEWKKNHGQVTECVVLLSDNENENNLQGSPSSDNNNANNTNNNNAHYFHHQTPKVDYTRGLDPELSDNDPDKTWAVEKILKHKRHKGEIKYLIKWEGFPESQNSWEPASNIDDNTLIKSYWSKLKQQEHCAKKISIHNPAGIDVSQFVRRIVDATISDNELLFMVQWKDFNKPDSWVKADCLKDILEDQIEAVRHRKKRQLPDNPWLIYAGPPCQGFSRVNRSRDLHPEHVFVADYRNHLIPKLMKYLKFYRPPYMIVENVTGMLDGEAHVCKTISKAFLIQGYQVRTGVLTCDNYGVPQTRSRLFFIAALPEVTLPEFPRPTHEGHLLDKSGDCRKENYFVNRSYWSVTAQPIRNELQPPVTLRVALGDLSEPDGSPVMEYHSAPKHLYQALMRLGNSSQEVRQHLRQNVSKTTPANWDKPVPTILASKQSTIHPNGRKFTIREAGRLQSFPDWVEFAGDNERDAWSQIGNAVPPLLAYHVGKELVKASGGKIPDTEITRMIKLFSTTIWSYCGEKPNQSNKRKFQECNNNNTNATHESLTNEISTPDNSNHDINLTSNDTAPISKRRKKDKLPSTSILDEEGCNSFPEELEPDRPQNRELEESSNSSLGSSEDKSDSPLVSDKPTGPKQSFAQKPQSPTMSCEEPQRPCEEKPKRYPDRPQHQEPTMKKRSHPPGEIIVIDSD